MYFLYLPMVLADRRLQLVWKLLSNNNAECQLGSSLVTGLQNMGRLRPLIGSYILRPIRQESNRYTDKAS